MRILYLTATMPCGSQEAFLIPEVVELLHQGHEVLLVPRHKGRALVHQDAQGLLAITLAEPLCSSAVLRSAARIIAMQPRRVIEALRLFRKSRNLCVLAKNLAVLPKGLWLADLALARGVEHIHAHWALTTATMAMVASHVSGVPWSLTAHRGDIVEDNLLRTKVGHAALVRFISQSGLRMAESIAGKAVTKKAAVIHMGVPILKQVDATSSAPWPATLLCPANLVPVKGHSYLLRAMAMLKARGWTCALEIAGDGPLKSQLQGQATALGIADRVSFLGQIPHDAILGRYQTCQVGAVVLPSVDLGGGVHEGIPVALIEAMAYGVPTISTTTGGIPELLQGGAGILVPPANPQALAQAVERLLRDPALRARFVEAGRNRVKEQYAIEDIVASLTARWAVSTSKGMPGIVHQSKSPPNRQAA